MRAVGALVHTELEALGFNVRWVDMAATGRAGHLVATHQGPGRNVLLIGHLDTVFEPDSPFQRFQRQGDRATGPGIGDDKGGLVGDRRGAARDARGRHARRRQHHHRADRRRGAARGRRSRPPAAI